MDENAVSGKRNRFIGFNYFLPSNCLHFSQLLHITQLKRFSPPQLQQERYLDVLNKLKPLRFSLKPPTQEQLQLLGFLPSPEMAKNEKYQGVIVSLYESIISNGKIVGANRYLTEGATAYAAWNLEKRNAPFRNADLIETIHYYLNMAGDNTSNNSNAFWSNAFWNFAARWLIAEAEKKIFANALRYMLVCSSEIFNDCHSRTLPPFEPESIIVDMVKALRSLADSPDAALFLAAVVPLTARLVEIQPSIFDTNGISRLNNLSSEIARCKSRLPKKFSLRVTRKEGDFADNLVDELLSDATKLKQATENVGKQFEGLDLEAQRKKLNPMNVPINE